MLCRVALGTQIVEQRINSLPRVVPCFSLLGLTPSGLFMGLSSTIIYTSELILCCTICVPSATQHNIHMYLIRTGNYRIHEFDWLTSINRFFHLDRHLNQLHFAVKKLQTTCKM